MKTLFSIFCVLWMSSVHAADLKACPQKILEEKGWTQAPENFIQCMVKHQNFNDTVKELCSKNQKKLSKSFAAYLTAKDKYDKALADLRQNLEQTGKPDGYLVTMLNQAQTNWEIFGYRQDVEILFSILSRAEYDCRKQP